MRTIFWQMMVTLDGFVEGPNGELDWHVVDDDFQRYVDEMLASIDTILLGRVTYEGFAGYWPSATEPEARRMNELRKIVFSKTLETAEWNNSAIARDVASEIARLRTEPGKDIALFGSPTLAARLVELGLFDEWRFLVAPVVLGAGKPLFRCKPARTAVHLAEVGRLGSGTVALTYRPR
jgi:dihydrofolate reductase